MSNRLRPRTYAGQDIDVQYELKRCIHAEACVTRLREVFDNQKRVWVDPNNASADAIADTIEHCPSGALKYVRKDGKPSESAPPENTLRLEEGGPIYVHGDIHLILDNEVVTERRVALCRCGASANKPFCDGSHEEIDFQTENSGTYAVTLQPLGDVSTLTIEFERNGPIIAKGNMRILNASGEVIYTGTEEYLCRCGHSSNKPFCDSTHQSMGFVGE